MGSSNSKVFNLMFILESKHEDFTDNIKNNFTKEELNFILEKASIVDSVCICLFLEDNVFIEIVGDSKNLQIYYHKGEEEKYISKEDFMNLIHYKKPTKPRIIEIE